MHINLKRLGISFLIALTICVSASVSGFEAKCEDLRDTVLRLHILANSDSESDQALKLKVRDAVLESGVVSFEKCTNLSEAKKAAEDAIGKIEKIAEKTITEAGFNYSVEVKVDKSYFNTRVYDDFTLPAGVYDALIVKIGKAEGKNWWCVMFPSLCVSAAGGEELNDYVEKGTAKIALQPQKFQIRFKTVEIYEEIKKFLSNK